MSKMENINSVRQSDLCISCGTCYGICPKKCITLEKDYSGTLLEPKVNEFLCNHCGLCISICPGTGWDINKLTPYTFTGESINYLGKVISCYTGCSKDENIRINSASGGIVTEFLLYLLENGYVDGVVVSRLKNGSCLETETFIAKTKEEIISSQKSIYCPVPAGKIISKILSENGKFAFVGLPCHIAGLRKAQKINKILSEKINIIIGLFCSRTPNYRATENLLNNLGVDNSEISAIEYRGMGHPGKLRIVLKNKEEIFVDHLDYRYWGYTFLHYFKPVRCWLCHDHSAMLADISCGDNWIIKDPLKHDKKGSSIIVLRKDFAENILFQMKENQRITINKISCQEIVDSQKLANKCNVIPKIHLMHLIKKKVPINDPLVKKPTNLTDIMSILLEYTNITVSNSKINNKILSYYIYFSHIIYKITHTKILKKITNKVLQLINIFKINKSKNCKNEYYKSKVIMIGGFGWKDIGDEAMPHGIIYNLRKLLPDLDIVMLSPDPNFTEYFHKERAIQDLNFISIRRNSRTINLITNMKSFLKTVVFIFGAYAQRYNIRLNLWPNARTVLDEISSSTLLFNNGGGNLNSIMPQELYKKCSIYWAARILRRPVIISGQTIGPFYKIIDKIYAKFCINQVNFISFRDKNTSMNRLREIGVTKPIMIDAADDAMTIPKISREKAMELLISEAPKEWINCSTQGCIVMNLKGSMVAFQSINEKMNEDSIIIMMAKISDRLIEKFDFKIFYLPTDYSEGVDDRVLHRKILLQMKNKERVFCIEKEYDDSTLKGLISLSDYAIGSRYHFCVFAASENIPFLGIAKGIYQKTKLKGLADLCETPQCYFNEDISAENFESIWNFIVKFIESSDTIRWTLSHTVPILKEKSILGVKMAEDIIREDQKKQIYSNSKMTNNKKSYGIYFKKRHQ